MRPTWSNASVHYPGGMRKNTLYALALLLIAITIAGFLGVLQIWQA